MIHQQQQSGQINPLNDLVFKIVLLEETNLTFCQKNFFYVPISAPNTKRTQPMTHASIAVKPG